MQDVERILLFLLAKLFKKYGVCSVFKFFPARDRHQTQRVACKKQRHLMTRFYSPLDCCKSTQIGWRVEWLCVSPNNSGNLLISGVFTTVIKDFPFLLCFTFFFASRKGGKNVRGLEKKRRSTFLEIIVLKGPKI